MEIRRFRFFTTLVTGHFADSIFDIIAQSIMKIYSYSSKRSDVVLYTQDSRLRNPRGVICYRDIIEAERSVKACITDIPYRIYYASFYVNSHNLACKTALTDICNRYGLFEGFMSSQAVPICGNKSNNQIKISITIAIVYLAFSF